VKLAAKIKDLSKALALAIGCCPQKSTIPILSHFKVDATVAGIAITASDLDREVTIRCAADVQESGCEAIDGRMFRDIVARLHHDGDVAIQSEPGKVKIVSGRSKFNVPTLAADDFPSIGEPDGADEYTLTGGEFQKAANRVLFAASTDTVTMAYLCCVYVHPEDNSWVCVAADKPHVARVSFAGPVHGHGLTPFMMPPMTAQLMGKLFPNGEDLTMRINERLLVLASASAKITSKLVDGHFPDYQRVIPSTNLQTVRIDRQDLAASIARVAVAGGELGVNLDYDGRTLHFSSRKGMGADGADEMNLLSPGEPFAFKVNPQIAANILAMFDDGELSIDIERAKKATGNPMIFRGDNAGTLAVVMSMIEGS
jgi:DNA polymerase III subunit beta